MVVSYSPGVSFDRSRPPNEVFGEDRYVPYETVSHTCVVVEDMVQVLSYDNVL